MLILIGIRKFVYSGRVTDLNEKEVKGRPCSIDGKVTYF